MAVLKTQGTTIAVGAVGGPYNTFGQVTDIPDLQKGGAPTEINTTDILSADKKFMLGLKEASEVTITFNYDPDDTYHSEVSTAFNDGTQKGFQITLTDATPTVITVNAYITSFKYGGSMDDKLVGTFTMKYSASDYTVA